MENNNSTVFCWTILYPYKEDASFDFDLLSKKLIPEYVEILGDNCTRHEVRKGLAAPGMPAPPFSCIVNVWITSREELRASMADPRIKILLEKIAAVTDIKPLQQMDEVIG
jgi:hypothetical protein